MYNVYDMYRFSSILDQEKFVEKFIEYLNTHFCNQHINLKITNKLEDSDSLIATCDGKVNDTYNKELSTYINSILPRNNSFYDSKKLTFINNGDYSLLKQVFIDYSSEYKDHQREMLYNKLDTSIQEKESTPNNKIKI